MTGEYINSWFLFAICFGLMLFVLLILIKQSEQFYTMDVIKRKFNIMELQLPATPTELHNTITGLFSLPPQETQHSLRALRRQLRIDFLFMPLIYGCIFLVCWRVAYKVNWQPAYYLFLLLALGQIVPFVCDIIENIFLLSYLHPNVKKISERKHKLYLTMEALKWGTALLSAASAVSAVCYFWCSGYYSNQSLYYLLIVSGELLLFVIFYLLFRSKKSKVVEQ